METKSIALRMLDIVRLERIREEERQACAKLVHSFWVDWDDPVAMQCCEIIEKAILERGKDA